MSSKNARWWTNVSNAATLRVFSKHDEEDDEEVNDEVF